MLLVYFLCTKQRYTVLNEVKLKCSIHGLYWQVQKNLKMDSKVKWYQCAYSINSGNILELYLRWLDKINLKAYDSSVIVVHLESAFLASWQMYFQYSLYHSSVLVPTSSSGKYLTFQLLCAPLCLWRKTTSWQNMNWPNRTITFGKHCHFEVGDLWYWSA